jgi:hypothetical protein
MPTVRPLPVATIFSLRSGWKGVVNSGVAVPLGQSWTACGRTSVAIIESGRMSLSAGGEYLACPGERMISETGLGRVECRGDRCGGMVDWIPDDRRRRNRFAFSRGPASFLSMEPRRVCLGNCSSTSRHTVRRRVERVRMRLESKGTGSASSDGEVLSDPDREDTCAGKM